MSDDRAYRRPLRIPPHGWWRVLRRVWNESQRDNISVVAAGCAFFAIFALFPAISALVAVYVLWADPATVETHFEFLQPLLPAQAFDLVIEHTKRIVGAAQTTFEWGLLVSIAIALWSANVGTSTLIAALNVAYEEVEKRNWLVLRLHTLMFTFAGILAVALAMTALVYLPVLFALTGLPWQVEAYLKWLRWPFLALLILGGLAVLYRYGPCRRAAKWHWVSVGSLLAMVLWLGASALFSIYVENFANYSGTYGSLGAIIVLLFWLYLSFFAILLGAELNAELEHHTAHDTTVGECRPMGERGAYVADHIADD